jgi:hypothetical protein
MRIVSAAVITSLAVLGCRSNSNTTIDGNGTGDSSSDGTKIQDIQNDTMPVNTPVSLIGKVVTAVDTFGGTLGNLWVEEPEGGVNSGVLIFNKANTVDVSTLVPGDIVNVTGGVKEEFALSSDTSGLTDTEVGPPKTGNLTIIKTGHTAVPAAIVVDALAIGQMSTATERAAAWEPYEGVLITVNKVEEFGAPKTFGSTGAADDVSFHATGTLVIEASLVAFPAGLTANTCLGTVTGVLDYFFDYNLLPRSASDLTVAGTGCAPPEQGATQCTDGMDNDGNGFADCMDLGCEAGSGAYLGASCAPSDAMCGCSMNLAVGSSVNKVDTTAATASIGAVILNNVFVTAVGTKGVWVADSLTAAQNGGMFVFLDAAPTVTVGQRLATVQGVAGPFNPSKVASATATKIIELTTPTVGTASAGGAAIPLASTATVAGDLVNGAPFAGSLTKLTNLKVKAQGMFNQLTLVDNNNVTITMEDGAFAGYGTSPVVLPAVGTCYTSITGVMDLSTTDTAEVMEVRTINPRSAADMPIGTGCTGT